MLEKVIKLNEFGPFTGNVWQDPDFYFKKINLLYGFNGSGKTVFSNVLRIFSEDMTDDERKEIYQALQNLGSITPNIELSFNGKKTKPFSECKKILVFNAHFIAEHVYDGSSAKLKKFRGDVVTTEHLKNPQIKKIEDEIAKTKKQQIDNTDELSYLSQLASDVKNTLSDNWNKSITGHRLPTKLNLTDSEAVPKTLGKNTLEDLEQEMSEHFRKFKVSKGNHDIQQDIETIDNMVFEDLVFDVELSNVLTKAVSQDAYQKVKRKLTKFKDLELPHASLQDWFEDGATLLEHSKNSKICPLCDSSIPQIANIIDEYSKFFNEEFTALQSDLSSTNENLESLTATSDNTNKDVILLNKLIDKYQLQRKVTTDQQSVLDDFTLTNLTTAIKNAQSLVSRKQRNLGVTFSEEELKNVATLSSERQLYNKSVKDIEQIRLVVQSELDKSSFNLDSAKITAKDLYWTRLESKLKSRIPKYKGKGKDSVTASTGLQFYHAIIAEKKNIDGEVLSLEAKRTTLLSQLKKESEFVNLFLSQLCVSHFTIRIPDETNEEIEVLYKGGVSKKGLQYSLSEGEKTALAFAYFLSKIRYEVIENTKQNLNDYIIVIDDPVSSLDESRLFSTAMIIKKMFVRDAKQLFVFSHNLIFLKFMGNILQKEDNDKREDCYLENGQFGRLPKALCNYQTSYFYKIQKLQEYLAGKIDYDTAKDFIPNCIRIVLEAFLSFKLCRLKQGTGTAQKYQSAGLDKLITALDGLNLNSFTSVSGIKNKNDLLDKLWSIKNTVDPECHGNPQDISDFEFISETELIKISQSTLDTIAFLDQIHFQKITNM